MLSVFAEQAGSPRHSSGISSRKQQKTREQEAFQVHVQNNEGGEDTGNNLCFSPPRSCLGSSPRMRVTVNLQIQLLSPVVSSLSASPAVRAELCKPAERISLEDTGRAGCKQHLCFTAPRPPLCCSPHIHRDRAAQGSAQVPSRVPEGSSRVLKATGWACKAAGATGPQPEDQSRLFCAVAWNSCLGTDP